LKIKLEEIFPGKEIEETGIRSEKENNASSSVILSFFSAQLTRLSSFFLSANHVFFFASFQRKQLVPHGPSYGRTKRSRTIL
jgi:hypothetical protein